MICIIIFVFGLKKKYIKSIRPKYENFIEYFQSTKNALVDYDEYYCTYCIEKVKYLNVNNQKILNDTTKNKKEKQKKN